MKVNGILSQSRSITITATLAAAKVAQAISTQRLRSIEAIADTSHRLDHIGPQFGSEPSDTHVHHVAAGIERVTPDIREQTLTRADIPVPTNQMLEEEELPLAEDHRALSGVGHAPGEIEGHTANAQHPLFGPGRRLAEARPDPGDQLGEREGLGYVVGRAELE